MTTDRDIATNNRPIIKPIKEDVQWRSSKLNYDLCYNLHVIDCISCLCGALLEDAFHFLLLSHKYNEICTVLCNAA